MAKVTSANVRSGNITANDAIVSAFDSANSNFHFTNDGSSATADLTATSPASNITVAGTAVTGLSQYTHMMVYAALTGATGGVLDVYLQVTPDAGTTWVDYAHFAQLGAGAGVATKMFTVSKNAQQTTITAVGTGTSPALAANTVLGGPWGDQIRVLFVAGTSTSAGASQVIKLYLSN